MRRILLMYISKDSGHHKASLAIENALKLRANDIQTLNVNSFNYTNPILERIINQTYMSVIKRKPEFWGYLYDNPNVMKKIKKLRESIHKFNTGKLKNLIEQFNPDSIICTQAFPCGMVSDYKRSFNKRIGLYAVLTDYAPHSYWIFNEVDMYFVPSMETGDKLVQNGVLKNRILETGIPVDPMFKVINDKSEILKKYGIDPNIPVVLLMGGSLGFGNLKEVYGSLLKVNIPLQVIAICGKNNGLYRWFRSQEAKAKKVNKTLKAYGFIQGINEFMDVASILISKPGGITIAEALTKALPMLIINPIPGQEQMNTDFLLKNSAAIRVVNPSDAGVMVEELLYNKSKLLELRLKAGAFAKPDSARVIADFVLGNSKL